MRRRVRRRLLPALALAFASLALLLAAGEIALRIAWSSPAGNPPPERPQPQGAEAKLPANELRTVAELARPNARGTHKGKRYRTNSAGFRGPEVEPRPAPGVRRIAIAGDSFTMGSGVEEWQAYPARLEALFEAESDPTPTEVLNLGLSGLNLEAAVARIRNIGLAHHPDLIVYGFTANDIQGPSYRATVSPEESRALRARYWKALTSPSYLVRLVWPRVLTLFDIWFRRPGSIGYDLDRNFFHNPEAWADFERGLDELAAIEMQEDVCVHVFIHTQPVQLNWLHPFLDIYAKVEAAARERGLSVTQSFPDFRGRPGLQLQVDMFSDSHPNAEGHAILVRALYRGLRELPESCLAVHERAG